MNETFCTMTKGTYDRPRSSGNAESYAQRWNHSNHWRTRVQYVLQIGQTVVEFIEVFHSMTKSRIRRRMVIEHWPKANGKRCTFRAFKLNTDLKFLRTIWKRDTKYLLHSTSSRAGSDGTVKGLWYHDRIYYLRYSGLCACLSSAGDQMSCIESQMNSDGSGCWAYYRFQLRGTCFFFCDIPETDG